MKNSKFILFMFSMVCCTPKKVNQYVGYDMTDNLNQRSFYNNISYPIDRVNGYTIKQLEQALIGARLLTGWRDNIKTKYDNPTEVYIDELFNNWQD